MIKVKIPNRLIGRLLSILETYQEMEEYNKITGKDRYAIKFNKDLKELIKIVSAAQ